MKERIQKVLAQAGLCSRRAAEEMIRQGRVTIDGRRAELGDQADPARQKIVVDGKPVAAAEKKVYLMLNKPRGYVSTAHDERGRKTVADLVRGCGARVYPVGRLDYDSEGLLLMTNDGALTQKLTHPSHEIGKTYQVTVRGDLSRVPALSQPMKIDGYEIAPATVFILSQQDEHTARLSMTIHEGRNRQIRKMCERSVWMYAA
ncbi:MAG: pseudouridine synthase [Butyricicoccus sp.]